MTAPTVVVSARVRRHAARKLDRRATGERLDRSDMLRVMLAYADQHMPTGWRPQDWTPSAYARGKS